MGTGFMVKVCIMGINKLIKLMNTFGQNWGVGFFEILDLLWCSYLAGS